MTTLIDAFERRFRNPSVKFILGIIVLFIAVAAAVLGPTVIKDGVENYQEIQRLQAFDFADPIETWIRPWIVQNAETMIAAEQPHQWRPHNFVYGPCSADNLQQLPDPELRDAIAYACGEMSRIQAEYGAACADTNACNVPGEAKDEIRAVVARLDEVFGDLGLVLPYTVAEQPVD